MREEKVVSSLLLIILVFLSLLQHTFVYAEVKNDIDIAALLTKWSSSPDSISALVLSGTEIYKKTRPNVEEVNRLISSRSKSMSDDAGRTLTDKEVYSLNQETEEIIRKRENRIFQFKYLITPQKQRLEHIFVDDDNQRSSNKNIFLNLLESPESKFGFHFLLDSKMKTLFMFSKNKFRMPEFEYFGRPSEYVTLMLQSFVKKGKIYELLDSSSSLGSYAESIVTATEQAVVFRRKMNNTISLKLVLLENNSEGLIKTEIFYDNDGRGESSSVLSKWEYDEFKDQDGILFPMKVCNSTFNSGQLSEFREYTFSEISNEIPDVEQAFTPSLLLDEGCAFVDYTKAPIEKIPADQRTKILDILNEVKN